MRFFSVLLLLTLSIGVNADPVTINSSEYKLRIQGSDHQFANTVLLMRKDGQMNDNQTFYFSLDRDPFLYAILSDLLKNKPKINLWLDRNVIFPWGAYVYYISVVEGVDN